MRRTVGLLTLVACAGSTTPAPNPADQYKSLKTVTHTLRLPSTEAMLRVLADSYVEPKKLDIQKMRASVARALTDRVLELEATVVEQTGEVVLRAPGGANKVVCPSTGPTWGFWDCLRRVGAAVQTLIPKLETRRIDRILGDAVLKDLDPHTRVIWLRADACHFAPSGCPRLEASVGVYLEREGRTLVARRVQRKSPASAAGIRSGDAVLAIDGIPASELHASEANWFLNGLERTPVNLLVARDGDRPKQIRLTRKKLEKPKLESRLLDGRIGYVELPAFDEGSAARLEDALHRLGAVKGLVLDLRQNPGGIVSEAIQIADLFLDRGAIMSILSKKLGARSAKATSSVDDRFYPLAVLVDGGSASASELLAGALQDDDRALIVGEQTFGKGSMQRPMLIPHGVFLMTIERYLTGPGRSIQGEGVTPDVEIRTVDPSSDRFRLAHHGFRERERDREGSLAAGFAPVAAPAKTGLFVSTLARTDPNRDPMVEIAGQILRKAGRTSRKKALEPTARALRAIAKTEEADISKALQPLGLGAFFSGPASKADGLSAQLTVEPSPGRPGSETKVGVRLQNKSGAPVSCSVHLESDNPLIDNLELPVGTIPPGGSKAATRTVSIPAAARGRSDPVVAVVHLQGGASQRLGEIGNLSIEHRDAPSVAARASIRDESGDGLIQSGEEIELCVEIDRGSLKDRPIFLSLDGRLGPVERWDHTFDRLEASNIETSDEAQCFKGTAVKELRDGAGTLVVRWGEWEGQILGTLQLPVTTAEKSGDTPNDEKKAGREDWGPLVRVTIESQQVDTDTVEAELVVTARGAPLKDAAIYLNGKKIRYERAVQPDKISIKENIPVSIGQNEIVVVGRSESGRISSDSRFVRRR